MQKTITIGLTGGIASGKSAVSHLFEENGIEVIDADIIAREVVKLGSPGLDQIVKLFGTSILLKNKELNRAKLRKIVFNNEKLLNQLNATLHPLIQEKIKQQVQQVSGSFCIVVIPLLCESQSYHWLGRILVVDVKVKTQLKRLMKRDKMTEAMAMQMIESQCTRLQRLAIADDVINNENLMQKLNSHVKSLKRMYLNLK